MARNLAPWPHVAAGTLFLLLWFLVVANLGFHAPPLKRAGEGILALLILLAGWRASLHIRLMAAVLAAGTAAVAVRTGGWSAIDRGLGSALAVAAFLPVIVLLRATVELSPGVRAIRERVADMPGAERKAWMTGGAHLLASILTLGFVSIQRPMLPADLDAGERLSLAECGVRGLGLSVLWSPFFVAAAIAGQLAPGVQVWQTVATGLALAALGGVVAHLMFNRALDLSACARALRRLTPICLPMVLLVGTVVAVSAMTGWNVLQSVVVVTPAICIAYVCWRDTGKLRSVVGRVVEGSGRMGDEVLILTVSLVFSGTMSDIAVPDAFGSTFVALADHAWLVITLAVGLISLLGVLGLHPLVTASVIAPLTISSGIPIAAPVLAHIVVLGWSLSGMIAAWTLPVVVTAAAFEIPVRQLVFGANVRFVVIFGLAACAALSILNAVLV